jgi:ElaA protein
MNETITWHWHHFDELTTLQLHNIIMERVNVFVVEQSCPYPEIDNLDTNAYHLWTEDEDNNILAYLRITPPKIKYVEPSLTRILTTEKARGTGLGKILTAKALEKCNQMWPNESIRISAQKYLQNFYTNMGFIFTGKSYSEDSIPHIEMLKECK